MMYLRLIKMFHIEFHFKHISSDKIPEHALYMDLLRITGQRQTKVIS